MIDTGADRVREIIDNGVVKPRTTITVPLGTDKSSIKEWTGRDVTEVSRPMQNIVAEAAAMIAESNLILAEAKLETGYMIAKSILATVGSISDAINQLVDEVERKNKLDEVNRMLDKIEEYEDTLIKLGCLKEVYNEMNLVLRPTFELDIYSYCLITCFGEKIIEIVMSMVRQNNLNPLENLISLLWELQKERGMYFLESKNLMGWWIDGKFQPMLFEVSHSSWKSFKAILNGKEKFKISHSSWGSFKVILNGKEKFKIEAEEKYYMFETINNSKETVLYVECQGDENTIVDRIQKLYESLTPLDVMEISTRKECRSLRNEMERYNRESQIKNLTDLYIKLRNAVRDAKINHCFSK